MDGLTVLFNERFFESFIFAVSDDATLVGIFEISQLLANADFFRVGDFSITATADEGGKNGG